MVTTIFYSLAALVLKILFFPLENKIHNFAPPCNIFSILLFRMSHSHSTVVIQTETKETPEGGGGGGDFHMKVTAMIVGNFEKNAQNVPEFCFVGVVRTILLPLRGTESVD